MSLSSLLVKANLHTNQIPIEIKELVNVLTDLTEVTYSDAIGLSAKLLSSGQLCLILNALKLPLKCLYGFLKTKYLQDNNVVTCLRNVLIELQKCYRVLKLHSKYNNDCIQIDESDFVNEKLPALNTSIGELVTYLKRIGVFLPSEEKSISWKDKYITSEVSTKTMWPLVFLPDRNVSYIFKVENTQKLIDIIKPASKPSFYCVTSRIKVDTGNSESLLDFAYLSLEQGSFSVIVWIVCKNEASILNSFASLACRIKDMDPAFCDEESVYLMSNDLLISRVVQWFECLPVPWLLIFDGQNTIPTYAQSLVPKCGQGCIVIPSLSVNVSKWKDFLNCRPRVIELGMLSAGDIMSAFEINQSTNLSQYEKDTNLLLEMLSYSQIEVQHALNAIRQWRARSFHDVGPKEYLQCFLGGQNAMNLYGYRQFLDNSLDLTRNNNVLRSVLMRFAIAKDYEHANEFTLYRIIELLMLTSSNGVDISLLFNWISPFCKSPMKMKLIKHQATVIDREDTYSDDPEFIVEITSVLPRKLKSTGQTCSSWRVKREYSSIEYLFSKIKLLLSPKWYDFKFPPLSSNQLEDDLEIFFEKISNDSYWPRICDENILKKFLNIHPSDSSESQIIDKCLNLLDPLVGTNLINIQQRYGQLNPKHRITLGMNQSTKEAFRHVYRQKGKFQATANEVLDYIYNVFSRNKKQPIDKETTGTITTAKILGIALVPHALEVITCCTNNATCRNLCELSFNFCYENGIYHDGELFAEKVFDFFSASEPESPVVALWQCNVAECCFRQKKYDIADIRYSDAIRILESKKDEFSSKKLPLTYYEKGRNYYHSRKFNDAENCLNKAITLWSKLLTPEELTIKKASCLEVLTKIKFEDNIDLDGALSLSSALVDLKTNDEGALIDNIIQHALIYLANGDTSASETFLDKALKMIMASPRVIETGLLGSKLIRCVEYKVEVCQKLGCLDALAEFLENLVVAVSELKCESAHMYCKGMIQTKLFVILASLYSECGQEAKALEKVRVALKSCSENCKSNEILYPQTLNLYGVILKNNGHFSESKEVLLKAVQHGSKFLHCSVTVHALNNLAEVCSMYSQQDEAEKYLQLALNELHVSNSTPVEIGNQLILIGENKRETSQYEAAKSYFEKALEQYKLVLPINDPKVQSCLDHIESLYHESGELLAAQGVITSVKTVDVIPSEEGSTDSRAMSSDSSLSIGKIMMLLQVEGGLEKESHERILSALGRQYGDNNLKTATTLNNLGKILFSRKRYQEALPLYEISLSILKTIKGDSHPLVATCLHNIGVINALLENYDIAESNLQSALTKRRQCFGNLNRFTAECLSVLGSLCCQQAKYLEARTYLEECLVIRRSITSENNIFSVAIVLNNLGIVLKCLLMYSEAESVLRESYSLKVAIHGENSRVQTIVYSFYSLGLLFSSKESFDEARNYLERSLQVANSKLGKINIVTANIIYALADISFRQHRLGEAKASFEDVLGVYSTLFGENDCIVYFILQRLVKLYKDMNLDFDVSKVESRMASISPTLPEDWLALASRRMISFEEDLKLSLKYQKSTFTSKQKSDKNRLNQGFEIDGELDEDIYYGQSNWIDKLQSKIMFQRESILSALRQNQLELDNKRGSTGDLKEQINRVEEDLNSKKTRVSQLNEAIQTDKRLLYQLQLLEKEVVETESFLQQLQQEYRNEQTDFVSKIESMVKEGTLALEQVTEKLHHLQAVADKYKITKEKYDQVKEVLFTYDQEMIQLKNSLIESGGHDENDDSNKITRINYLIKCKNSMEENKLTAEIAFHKVCKELNLIRSEFNLPLIDTLHGNNALSSNTANANQYTDRNDSNTDNDSASEVELSDEEDGQGNDAGEEGKLEPSKAKQMKKKLKKQTMLIELLKNQIESAGLKPINDVITFKKAEQQLQKALMKLLEGDEAASDEFEKWDMFVRSHPEYKAIEAQKRENWKIENESVNIACRNLIQTYIPPRAALTYAELELALPKVLAKRMWTKKALWLTRMDPTFISRLHIADLQSKYSTQGLDEVELRAIWASLPQTFENDGKGDKQQWKENVLQTLQSKSKPLPWSSTNTTPSETEISDFINTIERNNAYRNNRIGPFSDPNNCCTIEMETSGTLAGLPSAVSEENLSSKIQPASVSASADSKDSRPPSITRKISARASKLDSSSSSDKEKNTPQGKAAGGFLSELKLKRTTKAE